MMVDDHVHPVRIALSLLRKQPRVCQIHRKDEIRLFETVRHVALRDQGEIGRELSAPCDPAVFALLPESPVDSQSGSYCVSVGILMGQYQDVVRGKQPLSCFFRTDLPCFHLS